MLGISPAAAARAAGEGGARLSATIDGRQLGGDVVLDAAEPTRLVVNVENLGGSALEVGSIRLSGAVLGFTFFDYDTRIHTTVPVRGAAAWTIDLDLRDLADRATGALPVRVEVRDTDLDTVAVATGNAEVHGSPLSVYGLFGVGLLVLAGLLLGVALLPLGRHAPPVKPWRRGLAFLPAGCVTGLFLVVLLSALRLVTPSSSTDLVITTATALVLFGAGCLRPDRAPTGGTVSR